MNAPQDDEAAEPVILENDDQDTVAQTRALPEVELSDQERATPDQLPTIGHVGRYALKYCIGEGGLGTVYAAHDPLLSRLIAIKTMQVNLPEQDREQFNALFLNEAKAAGSLSHPHIVTVHDAGAGGQGAYMAMELLRGKDLRQLLAVGWRPTPQQAALIVRRVADALSYAHHKGVIHRDIKPANIFMVGRTQPRVLDFGIARIRQAESQASDGLSRFSEVVGGSPYYMAPEQVKREPVDRRVDVYALGVVLYELLTGRRPFSGNDVEEIADAVLTKPVRPAHESNPEVPRALSDIAMRAMARDLVQRTRSARTLSQELREWLDGQAEEAGQAKAAATAKSSKADKAPKAAKASAAKTAPVDASAGANAAPARSGVYVAGGLAALALLAGIGWVGYQQSQKGPSPLGVAKPDANSPPAVAQAPVHASQTAQAAQTTLPVPVAASAVAAPVVEAAAPSAPVAVTSVAPVVAAVPVLPPTIQLKPIAPAPVQTVSASVSATPAAPVKSMAVTNDVKTLPSGMVKLEVSPWGRVFVGKKAMGVTPPMTQLSLPQGKHVITIRNDDAPAYTQTVEVKAGQSVTLSHSF